jgi:hypothetical protein
MPLKNEVLLPDAVRDYLNGHRIDEVVSAAMNDVTKRMPPDPLGHLAEILAVPAKNTPPRLVELRIDCSRPLKDLRFDIIAVIQGARVTVGTVCFEGVLFKKQVKDDDGAEAAAVGDYQKGRDQERQWRLAKFVQDFFEESFDGSSVDDYASYHGRCAGLAKAPLPGEGYEVDLPRATAALTDALLDGCARSLNITRVEFVRRLFEKAQATQLEKVLRSDASSFGPACSPPLRTRGDFVAWRKRWPLFAVPVFHGGCPSGGAVAPMQPPSLRCCAAFSPFAMASPAESDMPKDFPALGWVTSTARLALAAIAEGHKALQADKAAATLVAEGVAYGHPTGILQTVKMTKNAALAALGPAAAEKEIETAGVLIAAAEEAWIDEEGVYELETGKKLSLEGLVELYAQLTEDAWVKMIVRPFRPDDMSAGCELLRAERPEVCLVADSPADAPPPKPPPIPLKGMPGEPYGCAQTFKGSPALAVHTHSELAPAWRGGDGCGRIVHVNADTVRVVGTVLDVVMACPDAQVVSFTPDVTEDDFAVASLHMDELLWAAFSRDDDGESAENAVDAPELGAA